MHQRTTGAQLVISSKFHSMAGVSIAACAVLLATTSTAQAKTEKDASDSMEDNASSKVVIVTANRREQAISDLPQAISAVSSDTIEKLSASGIQDIAGYVPSLDLQYFGPNQTRVTVRGISPDEQTGTSTVSFYIDEVAITSPSQTGQPDVPFFDIERVEFLRGPQGTLYGEGAMGGTIRIITAKPDSTKIGGGLHLTGSSVKDGDNGYSVDGMINLPLVEDLLALRVVAGHKREAGWIDQTTVTPTIFTAPPERYVVASVDEDVNTSETTNVRAQLRFTPTTDFTIDLAYTHNESDVRTVNIASDGDSHVDLSFRPVKDNYDLFAGTISYDFWWAKLVSATSYTERTNKRTDPQEPFLVATAPETDYVDLYSVEQTTKSQVFTQELRVLSDDDQAFRWTAGLFYREGEGDQDIYQIYGASLYDLTSVTNYLYESEYSSYAVFGEVEYDLTEALTVILGGRWFQEEETGPTYIDGGLLETLDRDTTDFTPRATISYDISPAVMAYATYSEGYRSGGFNRFGSTLGTATSYRPDKTQNYEAGIKVNTADNSVNFALTAFYTDWADLQFIQLDPETSFTFVGNANQASSRGFEAEMVYSPFQNFQLSGSFSYTDAHLDSDVVGNLTATIEAGTRLPAVPQYRYSMVANYDVQLPADWLLSLTASVNGAGKTDSKLEMGGTYTNIYGNVFTIGSTLPAYNIGSFRAGVSKGPYTAALFVRNVWNERAQIGNDNFLPIFGQPIYRNPPRTVGLELGVQF